MVIFHYIFKLLDWNYKPKLIFNVLLVHMVKIWQYYFLISSLLYYVNRSFVINHTRPTSHDGVALLIKRAYFYVLIMNISNIMPVILRLHYNTIMFEVISMICFFCKTCRTWKTWWGGTKESSHPEKFLSRYEETFKILDTLPKYDFMCLQEFWFENGIAELFEQRIGER